MSIFDKLIHHDEQKKELEKTHPAEHTPHTLGGSTGAAEFDPQTGLFWIRRGHNQCSVGESDKALESYKKGLEIEP